VVKINPTFPNNTNEEISNLFYITFGRMKPHPFNFYKDSVSFSLVSRIEKLSDKVALFDYLEIDDVGGR